MSGARRSWIFTVAAALAVAAAYEFAEQAGGGRSSALAMPPPPPESAETKEARLAEWRKKYPLVSLEARLEYEKPLRTANTPKLSEASAARLDELDKSYVDSTKTGVILQHGIAVRRESLRLLHSGNVDAFARQPGNGVARPTVMDYMTTPSPSHFKYRDRPKIPVDDAVTLSAETLSYPTTPLMRDEQGAVGESSPWDLFPTRGRVTKLHRHFVDDFVHLEALGYVRSVREVAGFQPHTFTYSLDPISTWKRPDYHASWKYARMELVSLLKHETPRAYVLDHLPRMEELSSATAKTRPLDKFETAALAELRDGEELITASTPNRIEMLGAVRASKQCLECHQVPRGTLLGAFSYELHRDPQLKLPPKAAVGQ